MIRYALACDNGHEFESWFPSSASYDAQAERGLVECPVCGSSTVTKQLMAPALGRKGARPAADTAPAQAAPGLPVPAPAAPAPMALLSEREQAIRAMIKAVREHVTKNADYVGDQFASEARKMHYGETDHRSIYGEAKPDDARALMEEGIEVHAIPLLPDDRN
jgi:hypothetical protein